MEFQGRIAKVLPVRSGVSQRTGNEWKALPFIFEYFENPTDRFADSVMLETFDTKVIENLKEGMEVRCGFGHKTREYEGKTYNELRLYKIESVRKKQQHAGQAAVMEEVQQSTGTTTAGQQQPTGQQQEGGDNDDLPF
jgi:hypothetical protein